jgi:hypothetical protein
MQADLTTTNRLLAVMAAVSVLEVLAIAGLMLGGFLIYRRLIRLLNEIEGRHVAPAASRLNAILDDLKAVTFVVRSAAEGVDAGTRRGLGWVWKHFGGGRAA